MKERRKIGEVDFNCPNCGRELHRVIWEYAGEWEIKEDGTKEKVVWGSGFEEAFASCSCKAQILIAIQPDGQEEMYWLNKEEVSEE